MHSHKAVILAAQLLFRIYDFLPQVTNELRRPVRWDNVFSLLQRMMFVAEFLDVMPAGGAAPDWRREVMSRATLQIHSCYDWYESLLGDITIATEQSLDEIVRRGKEQLSFPESLKYLHLGNPESIVILPTEFHRGDLVPVADWIDQPQSSSDS